MNDLQNLRCPQLTECTYPRDYAATLPLIGDRESGCVWSRAKSTGHDRDAELSAKQAGRSYDSGLVSRRSSSLSKWGRRAQTGISCGARLLP